MSTFDYLFIKIVNQDGWLTYGLVEEFCEYLKCNHEDAVNLFWLIKNGYSKNFIKNAIFKITGKTTEELDIPIIPIE